MIVHAKFLFVVEFDSNVKFGELPEHFSHSAIFVQRKVHGLLKLNFVECGSVEVVFQTHLMIVTRVLIGQVTDYLHLEAFNLKLHFTDQVGHIQSGTAGQRGEHERLGAHSFRGIRVLTTGYDGKFHARWVVTGKGHPAFPFRTYVICHIGFVNSDLKLRIMALVDPLSPDHDPQTRELADFFNETLGFCPNSVLTMQHRPRISQAFIELNKAVMDNRGRVTSDLKRMIAWVSSNATGCRYCQAHAIRAAERYGATQEKLENIWEYRTHPAFSEAERAALDFSLLASQVPNAVDETIKQRLYQHWDEGEIVEMLGVISLFGYLNRWNDSMGTRLEEGAIESGATYLSQGGWNRGKHH